MPQRGGSRLTGCILACLLLMIACSNAVSSSDSTSPTSTEITAIVFDSVGGSAIGGATIVLVGLSGSAIGSFTTGSDGTVSLTSSLTIGDSYSITASASGRASSEMANYVAAAGSTVALYCHMIGINGVSATVPTIEYIKYSTDNGATWTSLSTGATVSGSFEIEAGVLGVVAVKATSWSGFGIGIDLDRMPTNTNGYNSSSSSLVSTVTDATLDSSTGKYRTVALFNLSGLTFLSGSHTLELVAYDVANNRVEERIPFTFE